MREFWGDDEQTAELTRERLVDGWVRTRDIGRIDANGFVYVLDRADDMIVSGGFNIWPAELETVINEHPEVIEVAVFAIPHSSVGGVPDGGLPGGTDGASVTSEEIVDLVIDRLGSYKKPGPGSTSPTDPLPKTVVGKLMRKALRDPHWAGQASRVAGA